MKFNIKVDGISVVLKAIKNIKNNFIFEETASDEFKKGFDYAINAIIKTLEILEDGDND